ncbi:hypothetical protein NK897_24060, partial [Salmonella enterica subsp. enterica serovar Typhimurium]|nr:hypothetical protein [Salmonella enterica subsp. enterica serovar Typhimurium]
SAASPGPTSSSACSSLAPLHAFFSALLPPETTSMTRATDDRLLPDDLPQAWRSGLATQLQPGEAVQVWLQTDLDDTLHFATN